MTFGKATALAALAGTSAIALAVYSGAASAQTNIGSQAPEAALPFNMTQVATFSLPWRIAFLPDGRMLVTEKTGPIWLVTQAGEKTPVANVPKVVAQGQGGMFGAYLAPTYAKDHVVYITYAEPIEAGGSSLALAKARLSIKPGAVSLDDFKVIWRDGAGGKGGQFGAQVAFSPDGKHLFLTSGDRQRMTPAQDDNSPLGKVLRLTLDGKPAPGNPMAGKVGAPTIPIIDPPVDTEKAKTAPVVRDFKFPGPNLTLAETWSKGHRTPYGLAFAPDGKLWEAEMGPRGGDGLYLIEPGKNYGWPLERYATNYNGVPIPSPDSVPGVTKPVLYWTPVIDPGNLMFYHGKLFPQWTGSAFVSGLGSKTINRIVIKGATATSAERWPTGHRMRDIEEAPDGSLWAVEDAAPGGLFKITPK
jgi:glucose/arabinose dehydrogenase